MKIKSTVSQHSFPEGVGVGFRDQSLWFWDEGLDPLAGDTQGMRE